MSEGCWWRRREPVGPRRALPRLKSDRSGGDRSGGDRSGGDRGSSQRGERPQLSPKIPALKPISANGSGPGGRVEIGDIRAKLGEIRGEVDSTTEKAKPLATYGAIAGVVVA